ncbi:hypothetical protein HYDPIDRAFT_164633 [Hydnomerulius pinastri MD-312]|nr:hypothetical protein HYDPIDRAFT_164633 [Hydnomerulius pinastri MD-312]
MASAALDQRIVATALPSIVADLGGGDNYSWVGRAIQGIGGGGAIQLVMIVMLDIVPLEDQGWYSGFIGATYGIAGPTGGIAVVILFFSLNLNPHHARPIREEIAELDFVGILTLVRGVACLLTGFNFSQASWSAAKTIALLVIGCVLLVLGDINETFTKRSAIMPPRLFKTRTAAVLLITAFLHAVTYFAGIYYIPLYFQVLAASATGAGIRMIPYSLGTAFMSVLSGFVVSRKGAYQPIIWASFVAMTLGWGLMIKLDDTSSTAEQEVYPLIVALGIGPFFQISLIAIQAAMPLKDMTTSTGGLMFLGALGGAVGISVGEAIVSSILPRKLALIPNIDTISLGTSAAALNDAVRRHISSIPVVQAGDDKAPGDAETGITYAEPEIPQDDEESFPHGAITSNHDLVMSPTNTLALDGKGKE